MSALVDNKFPNGNNQLPNTPDYWCRQTAIDVCEIIEEFAPHYGFHVALTGGCLYKGTGQRKDLDILFYRIRQRKHPDRKGLISRLSCFFNASKTSESFGWMTKIYSPIGAVDVFFPEDEAGDYIPTATLEHEELKEVIK